MIQKGLVSVVMTNYNTPERYLREAIESILNQTYTNFEFIIVDDCSTDDSVSVIESYSDSRIRVIKNSQNMGLTKSLNVALKECNGEFIARMDSDDICVPTRFEKQVEYLKKNDEIIVCGTWAQNFGDKSTSICRKIPDRENYAVYLLFGNYPNIVHTSAMFNRKKMLEYNIVYNENYIYAQDYRMWLSCNKVAGCAIIPEILVKIRVREGTISTAKKDEQENCAERIVQEQLDKLNLKLSDDNKKYHMHLFSRKGITYDIGIKKWIKTIISANKTCNVYNQKCLEKLLWGKWTEICYYGFAQNKGLIKRVKILLSLNIKHYSKLWEIKKEKWVRNDGFFSSKMLMRFL